MGDRIPQTETIRTTRAWRKHKNEDGRGRAAEGVLGARLRDAGGDRGNRRPWRTAGLCLTSVAIAAGLGLIATRPAHVPRDPTRPRVVEPFSLKDNRGRIHQPRDWRDARAVVLFVQGPEGRFSRQDAAVIRRLVPRYTPRGVAFFGLDLDPRPGGSAGPFFGSEDEPGPSFPVLLDPARELAADLGLPLLPAAAVLDGEGHVLHVSPIRDGLAPATAVSDTGGARRPTRSLDDALAAAVAGELPLQPGDEAADSPGTIAAPLIDPDAEITFHKDVAPILWRRCAGCHRPGEVGPFPLLTYRDAAKRAQFLSDVASSRRMPPWRAVHGYGDFEDDGRLSRRELATLARWAERGAPEGDPAEGTVPPRFPEGWQLGTPDRVLTISEAYELPAGEGDDFRTFVLPLQLERDVAVAAVEFRPGNRRIVHHARFYVDPTDECRRRDDAAPGPGFPSFGGEPLNKPGLGAWVPGQVPRFPPEGVGKVVRRGSDLVVLIHYHGTGKPEADRSSIGLYYCKTPPRREMLYISLSSDRIDIPPGAKRHRMALTYRLRADAHALSMIPHGHRLMREISLTATLPGGKVVPMLWIDDWDFNWQGQYHFARPVALPEGTRLDLVAYYDNSADNPLNPFDPPRRVKYGIRSDAEMLGCHVAIVADDDEAQRTLEKWLPPGL